MSLLLRRLRRALAAAGTLLVASMLLFAVSELAPGDAAHARLGLDATPQGVALLRAELGLDRPLAVRYLDWLTGVLHGDLGTSVGNGEPVAAVLGTPVLASTVLAVVAGVLAMLVAAVLGIASGLRAGRPVDTVLSAVALVLVSVPPFVLAVGMVLLFALLLRVLPAATVLPPGRTVLDVPQVLVLPAVTLALFLGGWASRMVRAQVAELSAAPHVQAARLAGLSTATVLRRHLLPCAAGPLAQVAAWVAGVLAGGTLVVELVFGYPGLGSTMVAAVTAHDTPVLEATGLLFAAVIALAFPLADVVADLVDPRRRRG